MVDTPDWAKFVKRIGNEWYPNVPKNRLAMDNLGTHKPRSLYAMKETKRIQERF
jgi:hypothetical protein